MAALVLMFCDWAWRRKSWTYGARTKGEGRHGHPIADGGPFRRDFAAFQRRHALLCFHVPQGLRSVESPPSALAAIHALVAIVTPTDGVPRNDEGVPAVVRIVDRGRPGGGGRA